VVMMMCVYVWMVVLWWNSVYGSYLFQEYPALSTNIPHIFLSCTPSPVDPCPQFRARLGHKNLFIKRDDLLGINGAYGGNKVRKLEFLLADALHAGAHTVITFGCTGTNHGLATAWYARQCGLNCVLLLKHQPNSWVVRNNLLLSAYVGARIDVFADSVTRQEALEKYMHDDAGCYFFPTGGSVPLGCLGFVNAAFEIKKQVDQGFLPEPDYVYMPIGSCGTVAGLLLGLRMAGMRTRVVAVAVEPEEYPGYFLEKTRTLFQETQALLRAHAHTVPVYPWQEDRISIRMDVCGPAYGVWLCQGDKAAHMMQQTEGIVLEGTYSAKACAVLMDDIAQGRVAQHDNLLFWNTYCGLDYTCLTRQVNYKQLNPVVHHYFENVTA
jgi:1-aminocyclopropane-1-carboxylate deaminase/D-cysteine desulfhydrase-like pyridoxal-dependent ACC family enzyme